MAVSVVTMPNLGNEFDLGVMETGKIHLKVDGVTILRDAGSGVVSVNPAALTDVNVQGLNWNPLTNELTLTESDGSAHVVNLATLAADKFLAGSSYDPATNILTLAMTDGSTYVIDFSDLQPAATSGGIQGNGTTGNEVRPDFDSLPAAALNSHDLADTFVMSTQANPDGAKVPVGNAAFLVYDHLLAEGVLDVQTGVGISGTGNANGGPVEFAAQELPLAGGSFDTNAPDNYTVMSTPAFPTGTRVTPLQAAENQWIGYTEGAVDNRMATAVPSIIASELTVDVQDAFGVHQFFALP